MALRSFATAALVMCQTLTHLPAFAAPSQNGSKVENGFFHNGEWLCFYGYRKEGNYCIREKDLSPKDNKNSYDKFEANFTGFKDNNAELPRNIFNKNISEARSGNTERYIDTAKNYMEGYGVIKNTDKALFWAFKAAKEKIPEAYFVLSKWYYLSIGVEQDLQKSYEYLRIAKELGYKSDDALELQKNIKEAVGSNGYACLGYGLTYKSMDYATCAIQVEQNRQNIEREKRRLAIEERQLVLEIQQQTKILEAELAEAEARGRQIEADIKNAERRERQRSADAWLDLARNLGQPTYTRPNNPNKQTYPKNQTADELSRLRRCLGDKSWC